MSIYSTMPKFEEADTYPSVPDGADIMPILPFVDDQSTGSDTNEIAKTEPSKTKSLHNYFKEEQSWEGVVTDVYEDSFRARLADMSNPDLLDDAEITFDAVTDQDDLRLIKLGANFFWTIGTRIEKKRREQVSIIQFRRLPQWTKTAISESRIEGQETFKKLDWQE